jgi:ubiquitin C-terminal hydrolase
MDPTQVSITTRFVFLTAIFPLEHSSKQKASNYLLYGVSHHSGGLDGGHYIGQVLDIDND